MICGVVVVCVIVVFVEGVRVVLAVVAEDEEPGGVLPVVIGAERG